MKFKKIEIFGFKSFANKIEVDIDDGIIGIIGPNGCGKSNFADAIRWVLGEQSAKTLRGGNMQDIIFSGTSKKKALSYCEVTLTFSEIEEKFNLPYTEMSVSRRLYRSGESTYLLNNNKVRLKDIQEKLLILGIGGEGYSIIGQGRVEEIISSKPIDRRAIFEEATGISGLREKKKTIENDLSKVEDNINNFNNLISEIGRQIAPLEKEALRAEKYNRIAEDLKVHELNIYFSKKEERDKKTVEYLQFLQSIKEELEQKTFTKNQHIKKTELLNSQIDSLDEKLRKLNNKKLNLSVSNEKVSGELKVLSQRIEFLERTNSNLKAENEEKRNLISDYNYKIENYLKEKNELQVSDSMYKEEFQKLEIRLNEVRQLVKSYNEEVHKERDKMMSSYSQLADIKANLAEYKAKLAIHKEQLNKEEETRVKTAEKEFIVKTKLERAEQQIADLRVQRDNYYININKSKTEDITLVTKLDQLERQISKLENTISNCKLELTYINTDIEKNMGYSSAVRNIVGDSKIDSEIKSRLLGVVGECVDVTAELEVAIATALGNFIQNVITQDKQTARYLIDHLKKKGYGRITFLPINGFKRRSLDSQFNFVLNMPGCLGIACELVKYDKKFDNIYSGLLGSTLIVDNLKNAIEISNKCGGALRIVTLEGDEITVTGAMSGGSRRNNENSVIASKRQYAEKKQQLQQAEENLENSKQERVTVKTDIQSNKKTIDELVEKTSKIDSEIACLNSVLNENQPIRENYIDSLSKLDDEINSKKLIINNLENTILAVENEDVSLLNANDDVNNNVSEKQAELDKLNAEQNELSAQITLLRTSLASTSTRMKAVEENVSSITSQIQLDSNKIEVNFKTIGQNENEIVTLKTEREQTVVNNCDINEINNINADIVSKEAEKVEIKAELSDIQSKLQAVNERLTELSNDQIKYESRMQNMEEAFEKLASDTRTKYEVIFNNFEDDAMKYRLSDYNLKEGLELVSTYRKQLSAMGSINLQASEQIREVKERYDENVRQKDDLCKAKDDILAMLLEITTEMITKFNNGFEKIQQSFTNIFRELFGGGNARLIIVPSETGDSLDDGVDIEVQLPGKSLKRISLLSGGEKALTAIAILFSILSLNPMPFCVLDEIEAALDEANVERFAKYLKNYSKKTQFIVITHRKPTMEFSDALYGVTMEEGNGISKVISVALKYAVENFVDNSTAGNEEQEVI